MDEKAHNPMASEQTFDPEKHKSQWMPRWGMILSVICTSVFAITVLTGLLTRFRVNAGQTPTFSAAEELMDVDSEKEAIITTAFVQRHSPWMHEHDSNGNVIVDQRGRPVLTPNGKRLIQYMDEAEAKGVRRFAVRASYAVRKLAEDGVVIPRQ